MALLMAVFLRVMGLLMSGILLFSVPPRVAKTIVPEDEDNLKLQFSVIADVHMESLNYARYRGFARTLSDIKASQQKQDALVLLGDNTKDGKNYEYIMLYSLLSRYNNTKHTLAAIGNHDLNPSEYSLRLATSRHNYFFLSYAGNLNIKPYYTKEINGYTFIVLGDEGPKANGSATISKTQLQWLEKRLQAAAKKGRPIFVFNHQPLNHTFPGGGWGGVGAQSGQIREIIKRYPNVFFFSAHLHTPANKLSIQKKEGVTYVNVPTLLSKEPTGVGYQVEVYGNRVLLRARDYIKSEWRANNRYSVKLG